MNRISITSRIETKNLILLLLVFIYVIYITVFFQPSDEQGKQQKKVEAYSPIKQNYSPIWTAKGPRSYDQLEEELFKPLGYRLVEKSLIPTLEEIAPQTCEEIFVGWLEKSEKNDESGTPPKTMPNELKDKYLMNGYADTLEGYCDNRSGKRTVRWGSSIDDFIKKNITSFEYYGKEGVGMYYAMKYMGLNNQTGAVIGSLAPWVEAFAFKNGAKKVVTMEYAKILIKSDKLSYMHPVEVAKDYKNQIGKYDFIATFSSIEHSGLGRFGDALDPDGDIKEVRKIACMLKKGGMFFLGIPFGYDTVHFNLHRIYGRIRLAIMLTGFELLHIFYVDNQQPLTPEVKRFEQPGGSESQGGYHQMVLVLKKK